MWLLLDHNDFLLHARDLMYNQIRNKLLTCVIDLIGQNNYVSVCFGVCVCSNISLLFFGLILHQ